MTTEESVVTRKLDCELRVEAIVVVMPAKLRKLVKC